VKTRLLLLLAVFVILIIFWAADGNPSAAQGPVPTKTPTPTAGQYAPDQSLPDDIMPPIGIDQQHGIGPIVPAEAHKVIPIVFVPNDLTPNPLAVQFIDKQMQLIQRWYAEQLRGRTFDLEPARIVMGTHPLSHYYGDCYPPRSSCGWGYNLWGNIFADLPGLGYAWQSNHIHGVFLQNDGVGAPALGGGNQFLVGVDTDNVTLIEDCWYPGCASSINKGGAAHELGHAFGLPHTVDDPEGSPSKSLMNYGFYGFPRATLVNTSANPERDILNASPFFWNELHLADGGFEDCLLFWTVTAGMPWCATSSQRSGLSALQLVPGGTSSEVGQDVPVGAGETYDFSGWINIAAQTGNFNLQISVVALSSTGEELATFVGASYATTTIDWERFATSMTMPSGATQARIEIIGQDLGATVYIDDLDFRLAHDPPPTPLPVFYHDRDAVPNQRPTLRWGDVTLATSFRVQACVDRSFSSLAVDATTPSPFYAVPGNLAYDTRYYWRVKASNGAGESGWSPTWSLIPRTASDYYNDEFESGTLDGAWLWVREDPIRWGFGGPLNRRGYGYLSITMQSGDLLNGNNVRNILLRNAPPGDMEISTKVDFWGEATSENDYQAGLLVYQDDQNYVKLARRIGGSDEIEVLAEVNGVLAYQYSTPIASPVPLRLARAGNTISAYYSSDGIVWRRLGEPVVVDWPAPRIGLTAYSALDISPVTAYFDWFRVTPRCYGIVTNIQPPAAGAVASSSGGCNGSTGYDLSAPAVLTATANPSYVFGSWSGDVAGTDNPITLIMNGDKTVTANFSPVGHPIFLPIVIKPVADLLPNGSFEDGSYSPGAAPTGWTRDE
jgi:hypothetical protein